MYKFRLICLLVLVSYCNNLVLKEQPALENQEMPEEMMLKLMSDDVMLKRAYEISHAPKELDEQYELYSKALPEAIVTSFQIEDSIQLCDNIDRQNALMPLTTVLDSETTHERHKRYISVLPDNIKEKMKTEEITLMCEKIDKEVLKKSVQD